jgi:hypothetical protein
MKSPQLKQLRVDHLTVDFRVQRSVDPKRVRSMAENLNREALGTIIVSTREDGTYHVIDGQTRVAAMKEAGNGNEGIDCKVFQDLTLAEEAALFRLYNDTKQVRPVTKFMIRVVEGDKKAIALSTILNRHGWTVNGASGRGYFLAVAALEWVYDGAVQWEPVNPEACDVTLNVLTTAYGHDPDGVRAELVKGVGLTALRYGDQLDLRKLTVELAGHDGGPVGVIGDARQLKKLRADSVANAMAEVLVALVNKGRRTKKIPEWRSAEG